MDYFLVAFLTLAAIIAALSVYLYKRIQRKSFNSFARYISETTDNDQQLEVGKL